MGEPMTQEQFRLHLATLLVDARELRLARAHYSDAAAHRARVIREAIVQADEILAVAAAKPEAGPTAEGQPGPYSE